MWQIHLCCSYKQHRVVHSTTCVHLMTRSPLLDSFDPFATHPFTNNSGLEPPPPLPSPYPSSISPTQSVNPSSTESLTTSSPKLQKQPVSPPSSPSSPQANTPIFVPFRVDTSSPDLELDMILKKNSKWSRYPGLQIPNVRHLPSFLVTPILKSYYFTHRSLYHDPLCKRLIYPMMWT